MPSINVITIQSVNDLIRRLRQSHPCITHDDNCSLCSEENKSMCRNDQKLFKEAADMLTRYANTGLSPQDVFELKHRMEGLEK